VDRGIHTTTAWFTENAAMTEYVRVTNTNNKKEEKKKRKEDMTLQREWNGCSEVSRSRGM